MNSSGYRNAVYILKLIQPICPSISGERLKRNELKQLSIIELASSVYLRYKMNELIYSIEFYSFLFNCQINLLPQRLLQEAQLINARLQVALYRKLFRYDLHELRPRVRLLALQGSIVGWFTIAFRENWEESCFFTMSLFTELHFHLQISLKFIDFLNQML